MGTESCLSCIANAPLPACECTVKAPYVGRCAQQLKLKLAEADCDDVLARCTNRCTPGDCDCIDLCYASRVTCRSRAAALEGCVSEVCASECR